MSISYRKEDTDSAAIPYLKKVLLKKDEGPTLTDEDKALLNKPLFDIPEDVHEGHYEFVGENDLKVSFDLKNADYKIDSIYYETYKHKNFTGSIKPIFVVKNLSLSTKNFNYSFDSTRYKKYGDVIYWLPKVGIPDNAFALLTRRRIYINDNTGFLSTVSDMITLFHEVGHLETRTGKQYAEERRSINKIYSSKGTTYDKAKEIAYTINKERDANAWLMRNTRQLFQDLGVSREVIEKEVKSDNLLGSYYKAYGDVIKELLEGEPEKR